MSYVQVINPSPIPGTLARPQMPSTTGVTYEAIRVPAQYTGVVNAIGPQGQHAQVNSVNSGVNSENSGDVQKRHSHTLTIRLNLTYI